MKEYINNLNLYPTIKEYGKEFSYDLQLFGEINNASVNVVTGGYAQIPLFSPIMWDTLYSDVTEKIALSYDGTNKNSFGLTSYAYSPSSNNNIDVPGFYNSLYPYNNYWVPNIGNAVPSKFSYIYGGTEPINLQWGAIGLYSANMQYMNLLRRLFVENLLCTNINIKVYSPYANFQFNNLPIYFFHQNIDSSIYSYDTTVGRYVNPTSNASTRITAGTIKSVTEVDIPCSWVFDYKSGMTIPFSYDLLSPASVCDPRIGYKISFTFKQIK